MSLSACHGNEERDGSAESRPRTSRRSGVLLINLGTPDGPDVPQVRRYLAEFLSDPKVIQLPRGLRWANRLLGRAIARFRAPHASGMYKRIWTEHGSPLGSITEEQASLLESALPDEWRVFHAMRYGRPSIAARLAEIEDAGIEKLVVIPMYPQFSGTSTGTALQELYGTLERGEHRLNVTTRNEWYDDVGYVHAQARLLEEYVTRHQLTPDDTCLLFSAHGLPVSYVERGDPYPSHVARTAELVTKRLGWPVDQMKLSYQSRLGPAKWLRPNTSDVLAALAREGRKRVLVCPISFTTDCLETLEEIDVRCRRQFEEAGGDLYLCPALNTFGAFIDALKNLVLRGPRPVTCWGENVRPLLYQDRRQAAKPPNIDSLVMIGMSLDNRVGYGYGPELVHGGAPAFTNTRKPQHEILDVLRRVCDNGCVREAFLWNTCRRFELYGWPVEESDARQECIVTRVHKTLFPGRTPEDLLVNVLCGPEAWHHLVRTVAGLNSSIPGDRDVVDQLRQAQNLARRAGTDGPMTQRLVGEAVTLERELRSETEWGRFDSGYCLATLSQIVQATGLGFTDCRFLVIGGSSTSRSVLSSLIERFDVPSRQLALAYRGHGGGQIKLLRRAIRNGRRIRVQSYDEPQVIRAMADADIVVYGIDHATPALDAERIRHLRDFAARPLTVIDFNTSGSTEGLDTIPGVALWEAAQLDEAVATFASAMCATPEFQRAVEAAEKWIVERAPRWHRPCSRPHRCPRLFREAEGSDGRGRLIRAQDRWRTCVRCSDGSAPRNTVAAGFEAS